MCMLNLDGMSGISEFQIRCTPPPSFKLALQITTIDDFQFISSMLLPNLTLKTRSDLECGNALHLYSTYGQLTTYCMHVQMYEEHNIFVGELYVHIMAGLEDCYAIEDCAYSAL